MAEGVQAPEAAAQAFGISLGATVTDKALIATHLEDGDESAAGSDDEEEADFIGYSPAQRLAVLAQELGDLEEQD